MERMYVCRCASVYIRIYNMYVNLYVLITVLSLPHQLLTLQRQCIATAVLTNRNSNLRKSFPHPVAVAHYDDCHCPSALGQLSTRFVCIFAAPYIHTLQFSTSCFLCCHCVAMYCLFFSFLALVIVVAFVFALRCGL